MRDSSPGDDSRLGSSLVIVSKLSRYIQTFRSANWIWVYCFNRYYPNDEVVGQ